MNDSAAPELWQVLEGTPFQVLMTAHLCSIMGAHCLPLSHILGLLLAGSFKGILSDMAGHVSIQSSEV